MVMRVIGKYIPRGILCLRLIQQRTKRCVATMAVIYISLVALVVAVIVASHRSCHGFVRQPVPRSLAHLAAKKGFGSSGGFGASPKRSGKKNKKGGLRDTLNEAPSKKKQVSANKPFVKSEQDALLESLAAASSKTCIGQAVASSPLAGSPDADPFWELMPSLISSRFPNVGRTEPFRDPSQLELCRLMSENYETIKDEFNALVQDIENGGKDRFQSVTSMNYESGWKTLVLFYNGHRIPDFPYHLCPTTTKILETVPLAGRIAGFNRQQPRSGIPLHTDGNNMWLTCQMGIKVPEGEAAYIRVGPETRRWKEGECLLYDTTYEHETFNEHETQERVVLHVDFFNTLAMTQIEIEVLQYIYQLREEFMKAEGVAKVGAQIL